jgi:hypothetical protein
MKDVMTRLTKAEKLLITQLRTFDVFSFKDVLSDIEYLSLLNIVTTKDINTENIDIFLKAIYPVLKEREDESLKKLGKKNPIKAEPIEKIHEEEQLDSEKAEIKNDIIDRFKSRNYRNFIK